MFNTDIGNTYSSDIRSALRLLTRLPLNSTDDKARGAEAAWAYPLAGALVGLIAGLVGVIAHWCGLPSALAALAALTTQVAVTGAMHEDGLADSADGLWGGWTRAKRLEIMKDSQIGTYGVLALTLSVAARWSALWLMFQIDAGWALAAMITAGAMSRAAVPALMWALPHARGAGLSHDTGRPTARICGIAAAIGASTALVLVGWSAFGVVFWTALTVIAVAMVAKSKIGGQTGDTLGAVQQLAEIAILLSIIA